MVGTNPLSKIEQSIDEEEIFKTLSHQIRRKIIKFIGNEEKLTFSEIKNHLESIDSPTLSYHLKSLQPLLTQKENKYKLSEIGEAAFLLLTKTDQSITISKYRRHFLYAYVITVVCWVSASALIPLIVFSNLGNWISPLIQVIISGISGVNYLTIWRLRKKY
ncbi:MAG: helix-turn-helix transcriptional regulator [Candidatus Helarchaeota archaeon]|nr:helix-turn-helix transcriptional regulator [Candidatus Helarchaeota archaeon]